MLEYLCRFSDHKIDRHRVWHDRLNYRSTCKRCGQLMIRDMDGWRPFDETADTNPHRAAGPHRSD